VKRLPSSKNEKQKKDPVNKKNGLRKLKNVVSGTAARKELGVKPVLARTVRDELRKDRRGEENAKRLIIFWNLGRGQEGSILAR